MEEVIAIYEELKAIDSTLTIRRFSSEYLGMCETYLFSHRYYNKQVSFLALLPRRSGLLARGRVGHGNQPMFQH